MKTVREFQKYNNEDKKISVVTCYDHWSALILDETDIDAVLVGDSAAMVMHGHETTVYADLDMMSFHVSAVKRGIKNKFLIADIPFLAHKKGSSLLFDAIDKLMKAGAQAIKIEGADDIKLIKKIVVSGIPVMGHLGLTPQSINQLGGYKVHGQDEISSNKLLADALLLEEAGCFSIVLEMVPSDLARRVTEKLKIPTIGIGAGPFTSGQVLVLHDLLGMSKDFNPKFLRKYMNGYEQIKSAINNYNFDVKERKFPSTNESH